jgi:hypothetical protein
MYSLNQTYLSRALAIFVNTFFHAYAYLRPHAQKSHSSLSTTCVLACLFPVVEKSGTNCYHFVTRLTRPTDSRQVVPTSLISFVRNKLMHAWQQAPSNLLRTACISLVGTTCIKSVTVNQPCNKVITTCFKLITTTGNKQCEHIEWATTLSQQPCYNLLADL